MAWRRPGDKSLSEPMAVSLLTHICVTRPQSVKSQFMQLPSHHDVWIFSMSLLMRRLNHTLYISVTLPWIFPGAPLIFNGLPEISRITLTGMPWCGHNIWHVAPLYKAWLWYVLMSLQWCHNGRNSVSNHQPHDCLLNGLFRRRSKKNESSASLAFVRGIHRGPVNSPHKWPVTRKMFPFDDVILCRYIFTQTTAQHHQGTWSCIPSSCSQSACTRRSIPARSAPRRNLGSPPGREGLLQGPLLSPRMCPHPCGALAPLCHVIWEPLKQSLGTRKSRSA